MGNQSRTSRKPGAAGDGPAGETREALHEHAIALLPVLECLVDGLVVADREGRILLANSAAARIVGVNTTDLVLEEWTPAVGLFLPDTVTPYPTDQLPLARAIRGETVTDVEIFVRNPDLPEGAWISVNGTPWWDGSGALRGGIAVFRDITAHRREGQNVERLSNAVEQTADSVVITDRMGEILYVNPAFEQITGYSREEAVGNTPRLVKSGMQPVDLYREMWATLLAGRVFRGTLVNRRKSGELFYAEQTITPMRDRAGDITHFVSVAKDVTELRRGAERELEMSLAGRLQQRFYPRSAPRLDGFDIAGSAHPAAITCGDYFDYLPMDGDQLGIVVADVSGHGLGPALVMSETRAFLRSCVQVHSDLDEVIHRLNSSLFEDLESGYFVTMFLARLDVAGRSLAYVNAGHPPGYLLDASGEVRFELASTGTPLGVLTDSGARCSGAVPLEPGDILVFLTDGILESQAPDGAFFGVENALAAVRAHRHEPAQQILDHLYDSVRSFLEGGPQTDDVTAVICKVDA